MDEKSEILRMVQVNPSTGEKVEFFEIFTVVTVDGVEKRLRNADIAFASRAEAEEWLDSQRHT